MSQTTTVNNVAIYLYFFLGLAGLIPVSPLTYRTAWRNREEIRYQKYVQTNCTEENA